MPKPFFWLLTGLLWQHFCWEGPVFSLAAGRMFVSVDLLKACYMLLMSWMHSSREGLSNELIGIEIGEVKNRRGEGPYGDCFLMLIRLCLFLLGCIYHLLSAFSGICLMMLENEDAVLNHHKTTLSLLL